MTDARRAAPPRTPSGVSPLAVARAGIEDGRHEEALAALLQSWRETRAPEVAALVETLGAALGARLAPTGAQPFSDPKAKQRDRLAAWIEAARARRPAILSSLLANLIDGKSGEALQRLEALAGWDADPRVASTLAALVEKPPFQAGSTRPFWTRAFQTLREHADPRARARLAAMEGKFLATLGGAASMAAVLEGMARRAVADLDEQLPGLTRALDDGERAAVAAIEAALAAAPVAPQTSKSRAAATIAELYAVVYANPDDDGARQVLADALQEIGDPRGELIALQLSGPASADPKREKALYKKHVKEWLGAAGKILKQDSIVFERGFLAEGVIHPRSNGDARNAVGAPEWSTARRLRVNDGVPAFPPIEFETHPVLRGLRLFDNVSYRGATAIVTDGVERPLEVLRVARRYNDGLGQGVGAALPPELVRAFFEAPALPRLRVLGLGGALAPETLQAITEAPLLDRLEELELDDGWRTVGPIQRRAPARLRRLVVARGGYRGDAELTRSDATGRLDELRIATAQPNQWSYASNQLTAAMAQLRGATLSRVRLPAMARDDQRFMTALEAVAPGEIVFDET